MPKIHEDPHYCPIIRTVDYIGNKWKPLILVLLRDGRMRFGKIQMHLPRISKKILTEQLRELENDGLILRYSFNEKPPRVEYEATDIAMGLVPVFEAMHEWGLKVKDRPSHISRLTAGSKPAAGSKRAAT
ncbi:MAG TPA: helix-turn-helix domain-containing protein [Puia sp.]|jgi:DNA-binding HxlR family transcriptional regulator